jgi:protein SCO1/2
VLARYLSAFDRRIIGVTGTLQQVEAMERAYRVYARRTALDGGGYTMDHSNYVMLFDAQGRFVEPIGYGQTPELRRAALRRLLG